MNRRESRLIKSGRLFLEFTESEQFAGIVLILCAVISLAVANSPLGTRYLDFLHSKVGNFVEHWINDGLMAIFFLLVGLEIKRELCIGELSDFKRAFFPVVAAIGGMVTPALLHFLLNHGTDTQPGLGIPMATDIAFALGVLALLGNRVPVSLKIFLTALAIIDDLGAIIVIALFYARELSLAYLMLTAGIFMVLLVLNRLHVSKVLPYIILGLIMWYCLLHSGVHATLAGVLLAFAIPLASDDEESPSWRLQHVLHKQVAFIVLPMFALANTAVALEAGWLAALMTSNNLGIFAGLFIGKPLGIILFSVLAVQTRLAQRPDELSWKHITGAGFLGGIGFTMSIFITILAFDQPEIIAGSKMAILLTSLLAGITGFLLLKRFSSASFHQEMDVKEYIDELAAGTNRPRAEIINKIIREHRDRQGMNPTRDCH